jgi:hypothetical protein
MDVAANVYVERIQPPANLQSKIRDRIKDVRAPKETFTYAFGPAGCQCAVQNGQKR